MVLVQRQQQASLQSAPQVVEAMLEAGAEMAQRDGTHLRTALHHAAAAGHLEVLRVLLAACGPLKDAEDGGGATPLVLAAKFGHTALVEELAAAGADCQWAAEGCSGMTALHFACKAGSTDMVRTLLGAGRLPGGQGRCSAWQQVHSRARISPLCLAAQSGDEECVQALLEEGIAVDAADAEGLTALGHAVRAGNAALVRLLLDAGADAARLLKMNIEQVPNVHAILPLLLEAPMGSEDYLVTVTRDIRWHPIVDAVEQGSVEMVQLLVDRGCSIQVLMGVLEQAADAGDPAVLRLLLEAGTPLSVAEELLHIAVVNENTAAVDALLAFILGQASA